MRYRPDIDGLRAVAVMSVMAYHAFPAVAPGGFVGVDVFFVISGYLITGIIASALRAGRFSFAEFYARRIRRIFPALAVVLVACLAAGWFLLFADDYARLGRHVAGGAGFVANFVFWDEAGYFDSAADTKPLLHLWSLGVEEQFYLAWPLMFVLAWRRLRHLAIGITVLLAASFLFNVRTVRVDVVETFYSPLTRFWELLIGGVLACAPAFRPGPAWRDVAGGVGLAAIVAAVVLLDSARLFPGAWAVLPTGGAALVLAAGPDAWTNRLWLSTRAMVWVGLISYPLYLWHWPLLSFARVAAGETPPTLVRIGAVLVSVALAWATYLFVERPVRFGPLKAIAVPALATAVGLALAAGLVVLQAGGLGERAVNRSDRAHFLQYYDRMHKQGIAEAYRQECDFMDWPTGGTRSAIDASCTQPGARSTWLLWGDSYAQALSLGLRSIMPDGVILAQVATSLCRPSFDVIDPHVTDHRCERANQFAIERIRALRPEVVILAQMGRHDETNWPVMARRLLGFGVTRVVLVGPAPRWIPSLPEVVAGHYWDRNYDRVSYGLEPGVLEADRALSARAFDRRLLTYVSLVDSLCNADGCLAVVPGTTGHDLIALDAGHLTPKGSVFVAERVLRSYLGSPAASASKTSRLPAALKWTSPPT